MKTPSSLVRLFGDLNPIAMKPMGHIAGTASAAVGSFSAIMAVPLAVFIGRNYDGMLLPLITGFAALSILSPIVVYWAVRPAKNRSTE